MKFITFTDTNREMIELEKNNSVLREQVNHLKEELEKVVKIKLEKVITSLMFFSKFSNNLVNCADLCM